ncbi:hypothetical protein CGRA01v4_02667 [Colletotrichum graminicola]|nr:hypothetical protein CGRA01v4_02667 [Colletotrichum graminicola]
MRALLLHRSAWQRWPWLRPLLSLSLSTGLSVSLALVPHADALRYGYASTGFSFASYEPTHPPVGFSFDSTPFPFFLFSSLPHIPTRTLGRVLPAVGASLSPPPDSCSAHISVASPPFTTALLLKHLHNHHTPDITPLSLLIRSRAQLPPSNFLSNITHGLELQNTLSAPADRD